MNEEHLQFYLATLFRIIVGAAVSLIAIGGAMLLWNHSRDFSYYEIFLGEPEKLCTIGGIIGEACKLKSHGIIQLGTLLLMATPLVRIVCSMLLFIYRLDFMYVLISLFVLSVLFYSFLSGIR